MMSFAAFAYLSELEQHRRKNIYKCTVKHAFMNFLGPRMDLFTEIGPVREP